MEKDIHTYILTNIHNTDKFKKWSYVHNKEDFGSEHYICFNGVEYIEYLVNEYMTDKSITNESIVNEYEEYHLCDLKTMRGFYSVEIVNSVENHNFVIYVDDLNINIYNSYGGYTSFFTTSHNKDCWIAEFHSLNDENVEEQNNTIDDLFGFPGIYKTKAIFNNDIFCKKIY